MKISELTKDALTESLVDRLLFEGIDFSGQGGELVMVLGSRKACEYRVPFAVRVFSGCGAKFLLFSGGRVQQTAFGVMPEYQSMLRAAESLLPDTQGILTERDSMNTPENFRFSRPVIEKALGGSGRMILVTAPYHMRRALLLARRILPEYELIPAPTDRGGTQRKTWACCEKSRMTAFDECMKLKYYAEKGMIDNFEI